MMTEATIEAGSEVAVTAADGSVDYGTALWVTHIPGGANWVEVKFANGWLEWIPIDEVRLC